MTQFKYTLGADPEMLVRDAVTKLIVPVCGRVGGTKDKPQPFVAVPSTAREGGYMYQEDNVSFEVNVPPSYSQRDFISSISKVLQLSTTLLQSKGLIPDLKRSAHRFPVHQLESEQAKTIGCDPDMCAYGGADDDPMCREPFDIKDLGAWRYAGGHVHFGYDKDLGIPPHVMVRLIDAVVYLPIISIDKQKSRRPKYGLAGLYRPKPYGVEYRSMSNFWLTSPATMARNAFNLLYDIHNNVENVHAFYQALPIDEIKKCIDTGGIGAYALLARLGRLPKVQQLNINENIYTERSVYRSLASHSMAGG